MIEWDLELLYYHNPVIPKNNLEALTTPGDMMHMFRQISLKQHPRNMVLLCLMLLYIYIGLFWYRCMKNAKQKNG